MLPTKPITDIIRQRFSCRSYLEQPIAALVQSLEALKAQQKEVDAIAQATVANGYTVEEPTILM